MKEIFNFYFDFSISNEYYTCNIHDTNDPTVIVVDSVITNSNDDATQYLLHSRLELKELLTKFNFSEKEIQDAIDYINYEELEQSAANYYAKLKNITNAEMECAEVNVTEEIKNKVINPGTFKNPKYFIIETWNNEFHGLKEYFEFELVKTSDYSPV